MLTAHSVGERVPRVRRTLLSLPQLCLLPCVLSAGWECGPGLGQRRKMNGQEPFLRDLIPHC